MAVGIIATLRIQDGKQAEFEEMFGALKTAVMANEKGCTLYSLCRDKDDTTTYRVMEQYADEAALGEHGKSGDVRAAMGGLGGCLAGAPELVHVNVIL